MKYQKDIIIMKVVEKQLKSVVELKQEKDRCFSRLPYRLTPIKALMQHSWVCTSSSSKRNNSTCSIGCLAKARCIACSVGMCGSLSSRLTSRLPRGSPAPFMRTTVIGEYMSAKLVVRKMDSGPSYKLSAKPNCLRLIL